MKYLKSSARIPITKKKTMRNVSINVGIKRAFAIESSEFNTIEKLVNANRAQLASIPHVGKKSAEIINVLFYCYTAL